MELDPGMPQPPPGAPGAVEPRRRPMESPQALILCSILPCLACGGVLALGMLGGMPVLFLVGGLGLAGCIVAIVLSQKSPGARGAVSIIMAVLSGLVVGVGGLGIILVAVIFAACAGAFP